MMTFPSAIAQTGDYTMYGNNIDVYKYICRYDGTYDMSNLTLEAFDRVSLPTYFLFVLFDSYIFFL